MMAWLKRNKSPDSSELLSNADATIKKLKANAVQQAAGWRSALASAISGGYDDADTLHNIYSEYGYPDSLNFTHFWNMYRRFGIAKNIIEKPPNICWASSPTIETESAEFEGEFEEIAKRVEFWLRLSALDKRQRVGRYAGMFMRIKDGLSPDKPIAGKLNGADHLVQMMPLFEGQLTVQATDNEVLSDTFGQPSMYEFSGQASGNRNEDMSAAFHIHPDRIIIAAEGADDGGIYGIPALEACYNSLMDLRKIMGAGGEGFYKNAAQSILFSLKDGSAFKGNSDALKELTAQYDDFAANRNRKAFMTPGLDPSALDSKLVQPKEFFDNSLNDIAASEDRPATTIIGQQTGRLASSEDLKMLFSAMKSRQSNFCTPMIRSHIDWMIKHGILPNADYEVEHDDLLALSVADMLGNGLIMANINEAQFKSGGDSAFDAEDIREESGFEPEEVPEPGSEAMPEDEEGDEP